MQAILLYLLKMTVCSAILFLYYCIALRNKRFHYYNRFYLLMSVVLSLFLPIVNIQLWQFHSSNPQVIQLMNVMVVNNAEVHATGESSLLTPSALLMQCNVLVTLFLLIGFFISIQKLYRYCRIYPAEQLGKILFINTDLHQAPFSFFNNLYWKRDIDIADATGRQIFKHELTHIEQKHSWDKLLLRIVTIVFWMNPFYWLIQKELSLIHEFIADEKAIENKSAEAFALVLLQSQWGKNIFSPAQSFNYSPIKRRLLMLTTFSKTSYSYVRRIMILPLLAVTVLLFAFTLTENKQLSPIHTNAPFVLVVDAGHGGKDNGAIGINDIMEKDLNLSIAKKVQALAPEYGITIKMTRTEDIAVDLKERVNVAETAHPDAFISIHVSTTSEKQTNRNEIDVYIPRNESNSNYAKSQLLGSGLLQYAKKDFPVDSILKQRKGEGIYVIDQNPYPAVIMECGFVNNAENVQQLNDAAKTEQLARDILQGVVAFANAAPETTTITIQDTAKNPPLYILDSKVITPEAMKAIDVNTIESINILKDADAVKQYGEKGKNGVVVITLKKAQSAQSVPSYTQRLTLQDSNAVNATNKALKVVDGKIISNEDLEKLDAKSIESITVLKSNDAVNNYGEKGKDGVIEIKTKKNVATNISDTTDFASYFLPGKDEADTTVKPFDKELKYDLTFTSPSFPGGTDAWMKYLGRNLDINVIKNGPAGSYTAVVSFIVDADGNVSDFKLEKDPGFRTGAEAMRVIQRGPKWIPAQQNGHAVSATTKQAITFFKE